MWLWADLFWDGYYPAVDFKGFLGVCHRYQGFDLQQRVQGRIYPWRLHGRSRLRVWKGAFPVMWDASSGKKVLWVHSQKLTWKRSLQRKRNLLGSLVMVCVVVPLISLSCCVFGNAGHVFTATVDNFLLEASWEGPIEMRHLWHWRMFACSPAKRASSSTAYSHLDSAWQRSHCLPTFAEADSVQVTSLCWDNILV